MQTVCLALLDKGAHGNAKDYYGLTSLILAARNGYTEVCILLLRHLLLKQLLDTDSEGGIFIPRKARMQCTILTLRKHAIHKNLIPLIIKSKPLIYDYTVCAYDTYCCRPRLDKHHHTITKYHLCSLLGQSTIDSLKAALQQAYNRCTDHPILKNLFDSSNFDQNFGELFF